MQATDRQVQSDELSYIQNEVSMKLIEHLRTNKLLPRNLTRKRCRKLVRHKVMKVRQADYNSSYDTVTFRDTLAENIRCIERVRYNRRLGTIVFDFRFEGCNWQKLKVINEVKQ